MHRGYTLTSTIALAAVALLATACQPDQADPNIKSGAGGAKKGQHTIVYEVGGTATRGDLTYATPSGTEQSSGTKLPWKKTFQAGKSEFTSISVQNTGSSGSVTCKITVDGKVMKQAKSTGEAVIASCDYMTAF